MLRRECAGTMASTVAFPMSLCSMLSPFASLELWCREGCGDSGESATVACSETKSAAAISIFRYMNLQRSAMEEHPLLHAIMTLLTHILESGCLDV